MNHLSAHGANCLAATITTIWRERGYPKVKVWTAPINQRDLDYPQDQETYIVRSNMIGGFPPK